MTSDIPAAVTESTVSGWGFTKNTGTVTGVKIGGSSASINNGIASFPIKVKKYDGSTYQYITWDGILYREITSSDINALANIFVFDGTIT